jgi:ribose/xylose/arabinose/galactoside ABC-type transport system permease subunit
VLSVQASTAAGARPRFEPVQVLSYAVFAVTLGLILYGAIDTPGFLTGTNVRSILAQSAYIGVFAVATTLIMISGNLFSLSLAVTGAVTATTFLALLPHGSAVAIVATLALGTVILLVQGLAIGVLGANPIIISIAAGGLQEGVFLWATKGSTIVPPFGDTSYQWLNRRFTFPWIGQLPLAVYVLLAMVIVLELVLRLSRFGKLLFLVGESRIAARAAGLPTAFVIAGAFALAGLCTAIAGIELGAFNASGSLLVESNFTYDGIAAAIIGGSAIAGGRGSVIQALGGAILLQSISDMLLLRGYSEGWQILVKGLIVFVVVVLTRLNKLRADA